MNDRQWPTTMLLGATQIVAWGSSYYLPATLADPIAKDLGVSTGTFFAAFSSALLLSAFLGPRVGRAIDARGGNTILACSNVAMAVGLVLLTLSHGILLLWSAWLFLGVGMALGLYDAAFATVSRIFGDSAKKAITGITLIAGFASTIAWPLSAWGNTELGWRSVCFMWALGHLLLCLPAHSVLLRKATLLPKQTALTTRSKIPLDRSMVLLAIAFACSWTVTAAMAVHLPRILAAGGVGTAQAIAAAALIGPATVGARFLVVALLNSQHPLTVARLAMGGHPIGVALFLTFGGTVAAAMLAILHGAQNGILTIARGTIPLALFGPENYGYRLGVLGAPARLLQSCSPLLFAGLIDGIGVKALLVSAALTVVGLTALLEVPGKTAEG